MKFLCIVLTTFLLCAIYAQAQVRDEVMIDGQIMESVTRRPIYEAHVTLMDTDSLTIQDSIKIGKGNKAGIQYGFLFFRLSRPGKYILKFKKEGYQTTFYDFEINKFYKHESTISLDKPILLKRIAKTQELKEVTVKATKIKFYLRGDTIVYNADAFELEEGSMLDAVLRQLPDVELKKGGLIYVRGKQVSELLLNGRDFSTTNDRLSSTTCLRIWSTTSRSTNANGKTTKKSDKTTPIQKS